MHRLVKELGSGYAQDAVYQLLVRVFGDHFQLLGQTACPKADQDLSATSLQSPDDKEATYREKNGKGYQGYAANVSETCDPENPLQLITKVQTAPNTTDDSQFLAEALPNLKERTQVQTIYTDGGHGGPEADWVLREQQVEQIQTAIRGRTPTNEKLGLSDFAIQFNEEGKPASMTCPHGMQVAIHATCQKKGNVAYFDPEGCQECPLAERCPTQAGKRDPRRALHFNQGSAQVASRRRRCQEQKKESGNLRAVVEAAVRSVKHPFPARKTPVRGRFRVSCMMVGSAAVANVRCIQRYLEAKMKREMKEKGAQSRSVGAFGAISNTFFAWLTSIFGCRNCLKLRFGVSFSC